MATARVGILFIIFAVVVVPAGINVVVDAIVVVIAILSFVFVVFTAVVVDVNSEVLDILCLFCFYFSLVHLSTFTYYFSISLTSKH